MPELPDVAVNKKVTAAVGNGRDEEMAIIEELVRLGRMPGAGVLEEGSVNLADTLREIHGQ